MASAAAAVALSDQDRADKLEALATAFDEDHEAWPDGRLAAALTPLAHPTLTGEPLLEAFADYVDQLDTLKGVELGNIEWQGIEPALTCADPQDAAYFIQERRVQDALDTLLHGAR
jgi:hypothetical protein